MIKIETNDENIENNLIKLYIFVIFVKTMNKDDCSGKEV